MSQQDRIDALIATVRDLNHQVRARTSTVPGGENGSDKQLHELLGELRDNEHRVSRSVKLLTLEETQLAAQADVDSAHIPSEELSSRWLLSEFGTAREATLALLRELPEEGWARTHETDEGSRSIQQLIDGLIESDKTYVNKLQQFNEAGAR